MGGIEPSGRRSESGAGLRCSGHDEGIAVADSCAHLEHISITAPPGKDWFWCYPDDLAFTIATAP